MITGHTHTTFNIEQIPKPLMITGHTHKHLTLHTDTKAINDHWPHTQTFNINRYQSH